MTRDAVDIMNADYVRSAALLCGVLQDFRELVQREKQNKPVLDTTRRRLQTVVTQLESLGKDPGEAWQSLTLPQRWGYLRLISCLGTATRLLGERSHKEAHMEESERAGRRDSFNSEPKT